ncbi:alpha/beta hydrolase [Nonomuraea sp. NN258]|uniref:alpha/beta fold hydrolase n=1 Tax=Nonomuraea antri TaxID=2730852 RepID=UPI001568C453|nr:alpha/beta hydrolase [Nonomuraea antri]NRQ31924.1 alpha/beta hydrolase [Nonomuraea antri]
MTNQIDELTVTSADGTTIGYYRLGRGPGLVISHGGMGSAYNHIQQARALAAAYTVYLPDRRGRGLSGPYRPGHDLRQDVADLSAVITATGSRYLFGLSVGATIALRTALSLPAVDKLAVYDPGAFTAPTAWLARYERELAAGRTAAALVTAMKGARMGPALMRALPRRLLEQGTDLAMRGEERKGSGGYVPMRDLAPTLAHDVRALVAMEGRLDDFRALRADVLLLGGGRSVRYQKASLAALEGVLPRATRVELAGLGHEGPWNADRGGDPERVARELRRFFTP